MPSSLFSIPSFVFIFLFPTSFYHFSHFYPLSMPFLSYPFRYLVAARFVSWFAIIFRFPCPFQKQGDGRILALFSCLPATYLFHLLVYSSKLLINLSLLLFRPSSCCLPKAI